VSALESGEPGAHRFRIRSFDSPVRADHAVSRNEKRERRCAHGGSDATMRSGRPDRARNVGIRNELSEAKRCDCAPGGHLKRRPFEKEGQIETAQAAREICSDLRARFNEQRVARFVLGDAPARDEGASRWSRRCSRSPNLAKGRATRHRSGVVRKQRTAFSSDRWLEVLVKPAVDRVISLISRPTPPSFDRCVPLDNAVIVDSGSTNTLEYRIEVRSDGPASVELDRQVPSHYRSASHGEAFSQISRRAKGQRNDRAVREERVVRVDAAQFTWQQWVSPDLSCPPKTVGAALITDVQTLREWPASGCAASRGTRNSTAD